MLPRMPWSSSVNYQAAWQSPREFGGWESTADLNWATCSIAILLFSESSCLPIAYCWDLNFSKDNIMGCSLKSKTGSTPTDGIRTLLKDSGNLPWPFHPVETWHDISSLQPRRDPATLPVWLLPQTSIYGAVRNRLLPESLWVCGTFLTTTWMDQDRWTRAREEVNWVQNAMTIWREETAEQANRGNCIWFNKHVLTVGQELI